MGGFLPFPLRPLGLEPPTPPPPPPPPPPPSKQPHTQGGGKRRLAMEKIWLWKFFVVVPIFFFFICIRPSAACGAQETQPLLFSGKCRKWSEVLLQEALFNLLCLGGSHFFMSAKFRLFFIVVSTSGGFLCFGCMGTSPPSLWVTYAEIAGAPFIPVYNAKLAINTVLVGALMVIDPGFVGQQKL